MTKISPISQYQSIIVLDSHIEKYGIESVTSAGGEQLQFRIFHIKIVHKLLFQTRYYKTLGERKLYEITEEMVQFIHSVQYC